MIHLLSLSLSLSLCSHTQHSKKAYVSTFDNCTSLLPIQHSQHHKRTIIFPNTVIFAVMGYAGVFARHHNLCRTYHYWTILKVILLIIYFFVLSLYSYLHIVFKIIAWGVQVIMVYIWFLWRRLLLKWFPIIEEIPESMLGPEPESEEYHAETTGVQSVPNQSHSNNVQGNGMYYTRLPGMSLWCSVALLQVPFASSRVGRSCTS